MVKVLITGVAGQDGHNMVEYLLTNSNYEIYGTVRKTEQLKLDKIFCNPRFHLVYLNLIDSTSINTAFRDIRPDYCFNFAGQSQIGESFKCPIATFNVNTMGVLRLLEAIRHLSPHTKFLNAGSSEELGRATQEPQNLETPLNPISPYGASKCAARHLINVYRQSLNIYAVHCVLYNHEGVNRAPYFVTKKISQGIASISKGSTEPLKIGNIHARKDWSDSHDFMEAIWSMLQQSEARDYILGSGETHTVKEFIDIACEVAGITNTQWDIYGNDAVLRNDKGEVIVQTDEKFYRPDPDVQIRADCTETCELLKWRPRTDFRSLVEKMVLYDMTN